MSLYDDASLIMYPSGVKSGKIYSQKPTNGSGDLTFTRASTATRVNSSGLIEVVGSGVPRLDYSQGSCPALLLEPQRTNLALRSEEFDNSAWQKSNVTVTANTTTSPDGNTTADTISITSNNGYIRLFPLTFANSTTYTCSVFVKNNGISAGQTFNFYATNNLSSPNGAIANAIIDINNGSVTTSSFGSGVSAVSASISSLTNGWYRVQLTFTVGASAGGSICEIGFNASTATRTFFAWGAQLEAGAYATSYIPTTSATVTRLADAIALSGMQSNGIFGATQGTIILDFVWKEFSYVLDLQDSSGTRLRIFNSNTEFWIRDLIGASWYVTGFTHTFGERSKIGIRWDGTTVTAFQNGVKALSDKTFSANMAIDILSDVETSENQSFIFYPTPLSDSDCISLTTL